MPHFMLFREIGIWLFFQFVIHFLVRELRISKGLAVSATKKSLLIVFYFFEGFTSMISASVSMASASLTARLTAFENLDTLDAVHKLEIPS